MYYEHNITIAVSVFTVADNVKSSDVNKVIQELIRQGNLDYIVKDTKLHTSVEVVAAIRERIQKIGLREYHDDTGIALALKLLDDVIGALEVFQENTRDAL